MGHLVSYHHFKHGQPQEVEGIVVPVLTQSHDSPQVVVVSHRFASLGIANSEARKPRVKQACPGR